MVLELSLGAEANVNCWFLAPNLLLLGGQQELTAALMRLVYLWLSGSRSASLFLSFPSSPVETLGWSVLRRQHLFKMLALSHKMSAQLELALNRT